MISARQSLRRSAHVPPSFVTQLPCTLVTTFGAISPSTVRSAPTWRRRGLILPSNAQRNCQLLPQFKRMFSPFPMTRQAINPTAGSNPSLNPMRSVATCTSEDEAGNHVTSTNDRSTLLLVGLGNPGPNFENTPHNIGFHLVSSFASSKSGSKKTKFKYMRQLQADVTSVYMHGVTVHVLKPTTFMNLSGKSIRLALNYWKISPDSLLVVTDDVALEVGRVRLRAKGSAGGHNGLKSIQAALGGSQDYARLRIGVGAPSGGGDYLKNFVLEKFNRADLKILQDVEIDVLNLLDNWVQTPDLAKVISQLGTMQSGQRQRQI